jgi:cyclic pyranopterin phosphate synthase
MMSRQLSHIDEKGKANMVDVSSKPDEVRTAKATGFIRLQPDTIQLIQQQALKKGEVITVAELAGIQAAKSTSQLIPLCHTLMLTKVEVKAYVEANGIRINSMVKCIGKTGVEMEALTAVSVALLTVYDMCKAVDKTMVIEDIRLISKTKS